MSVSRSVECFYPGSSFPAISVTGRSCALDCKHCARKYLEGMMPATTPDDLLQISEVLAERGAMGFLLSGGADGSGKVRMAEFADAIREIKSTTDLIVNAHIGLTPTVEIKRLVKSGIDSFSVDIYGSDETIHDVLGLDARTEDYFRVVSDLRAEGASVAPHICIGIHGGELKGELRAIDMVRPFDPEALVFISLVPTKGTVFEEVAPPSKDMVISVVRRAREAMPETKLTLGCMRSKRDRASEAEIVMSGLDGIVLPAAKTVEVLRERGYTVKKRGVCCAFV